MDIETIRNRIQAGNYLVKSHAILHALKEGFDRQHMVEAILNGRIIEEYPDDQRVLVSGTMTWENITVHLHVVCEHADPVFIEFVTAYIPDERRWENPPYRRRRRRKN